MKLDGKTLSNKNLAITLTKYTTIVFLLLFSITLYRNDFNEKELVALLSLAAILLVLLCIKTLSIGDKL